MKFSTTIEYNKVAILQFIYFYKNLIKHKVRKLSVIFIGYQLSEISEKIN
jgi:hypothetical protein